MWLGDSKFIWLKSILDKGCVYPKEQVSFGMVAMQKQIHIKMNTHTIFSLTHQEDEVWPGRTQPMLLPRVKLCMHDKFQVCKTKDFSGHTYHF